MSAACEPTATLSAFYRETWFTCEGARLKARRLQAKGIPDLRNWRFITLTVDDRESSPLEVYQRGKDRLRRFTEKWRDALGREVRWLWKLEMHEDGFPHWHMLVDYTQKIPPEFFGEVASWWGLGRVNIGRVRKKEMHYVFKYVCKGGQSIPDWVLDFPGRIRCVQASRGFFTTEAREAKREEPKSCALKLSLRELLGWDARKAILTETTATGKRFVSVVKIQGLFAALLNGRAQMAIATKRPLPCASSIILGRNQLVEIKHEHRNSYGLGRIPQKARFFGNLPPERWELVAA